MLTLAESMDVAQLGPTGSSILLRLVWRLNDSSVGSQSFTRMEIWLLQLGKTTKW